MTYDAWVKAWPIQAGGIMAMRTLQPKVRVRVRVRARVRVTGRFETRGLAPGFGEGLGFRVVLAGQKLTLTLTLNGFRVGLAGQTAPRPPQGLMLVLMLILMLRHAPTRLILILAKIVREMGIHLRDPGLGWTNLAWFGTELKVVVGSWAWAWARAWTWA